MYKDEYNDGYKRMNRGKSTLIFSSDTINLISYLQSWPTTRVCEVAFLNISELILHLCHDPKPNMIMRRGLIKIIERLKE